MIYLLFNGLDLTAFASQRDAMDRAVFDGDGDVVCFQLDPADFNDGQDLEIAFDGDDVTDELFQQASHAEGNLDHQTTRLPDKKTETQTIIQEPVKRETIKVKPPSLK